MKHLSRQYAYVRSHSDARQPGFLLLEVVVAVGLLVMGMAVIGAQLQSASDRAIQTDQMARVVFLAESKLAEMNTGMLELELEQEEEFGRLFPHYGWRLTAVPLPEDPNPTSPRHPLDTPMVAITLEILLDRDRNLEDDEDFDFEEAVVVQKYHTLRTLPRPLDLTADFGLDAEQAADINEQLTGVGGGSVDVTQLNPSMFRDMDMQELLEVLPVLMPALGVGEESILNMVPAELRPLLEAIFAEQAAGSEDDSGDGGSSDGSSSGGGSSDGVGDSGSGSEGDKNAPTDDAGDGGDAANEGDGQDGMPDGGAPDTSDPDVGDPDVGDPNAGDPTDDDLDGQSGRGSRGGGRRGGR